MACAQWVRARPNPPTCMVRPDAAQPSSGAGCWVHQPNRWVRSRDAQRILLVHRKTLLEWARAGSIATRILPSQRRRGATTDDNDQQPPRSRRNHRLFDVGRYLEGGGEGEGGGPDAPATGPAPAQDAIYARVSTAKQTAHLDHQIADLRRRHPDATVYRDVASGLHFRRRGLQNLLAAALAGRLRRVYVAHRDRLARFGVELIARVAPPGDNGRRGGGATRRARLHPPPMRCVAPRGPTG